MPKRSKRKRGAGPRTSSASRRRGATPRRARGTTVLGPTFPRGRRKNAAPAGPSQAVLYRRTDGRNNLPVHRAAATKNRLRQQPARLPAFAPFSTKTARKSPRVCSASKARRRAVIIASGHGGRNGATNYKRHKKCS